MSVYLFSILVFYKQLRFNAQLSWYLLVSVAEKTYLSLTRSHTTKTGFLATRPYFDNIHANIFTLTQP